MIYLALGGWRNIQVRKAWSDGLDWEVVSSGNNAAIQSGIANNIDSSMRDPGWTYCYGTAPCFHCTPFLLLKVVPGEASSSDLLQNWQRHYRSFFHEEMRMVSAGPASSLNRATTWNLDGTSLMFIPWHFEDRRYSQEMTTMTPGYTISEIGFTANCTSPWFFHLQEYL